MRSADPSALTLAATGEAGQTGRGKRAQERKHDDGNCPTNADPKSISLPESDVTGGPLLHTMEPDKDGNKISSLHLFSLPVHGGADLAYDLSEDPAQVVAAYEEVLGTEPARLEGLLPLLQAAADAPLEIEGLDAWLPEPTEEALAMHQQLAKMIEAEGARQVRAIGARRPRTCTVSRRAIPSVMRCVLWSLPNITGGSWIAHAATEPTDAGAAL